MCLVPSDTRQEGSSPERHDNIGPIPENILSFVPADITCLSRTERHSDSTLFDFTECSTKTCQQGGNGVGKADVGSQRIPSLLTTPANHNETKTQNLRLEGRGGHEWRACVHPLHDARYQALATVPPGAVVAGTPFEAIRAAIGSQRRLARVLWDFARSCALPCKLKPSCELVERSCQEFEVVTTSLCPPNSVECAELVNHSTTKLESQTAQHQ